MKCVEIIVKTYPNYGTEDYYRLRPNEYSYVRDFWSFLIKTLFHYRISISVLFQHQNDREKSQAKSQMFLDAVTTQKVAHVIQR